MRGKSLIWALTLTSLLVVSLIISITALASLANTPTSPYSVTIEAFCIREDKYVSVMVRIDDEETGPYTPHTFTDLTGTHSFAVNWTDAEDHAFIQWSTGETSISISTDTDGIFTAYYGPKLFVDPAVTRGDYDPPTGSVASFNVNVSDIPDIGLWGYQFFLTFEDLTAIEAPIVPLTNMNFTDTSPTTWSTTVTGTGTSAFGYDTEDGNPYGSGAPSYYHRAASTASATASLTFVTEQQFTLVPNWSGTPVWVQLSYAYEITGNSIAATGNNFLIRVQKPDLSYRSLIPLTSFNAISPWQYKVVETMVAAFDQPGTYKFQLRNTLKTATIGATNYVQFNWDDVGVKIAPITVTEGAFLKQGGSTGFLVKYLNESTIYVANTLIGQPYYSAFPVNGTGTLVTIKFLVGYGASWLKLSESKLMTVGLLPGSGKEWITFRSGDGWFSNKLFGDANGDGLVNSLDVGRLNAYWAPAGGPPPWSLGYSRIVDCNDDGYINSLDVGVVNGHWGHTKG